MSKSRSKDSVRSGEYVPIKFKVWEMSQFGKKAVVECKPDRNQTVNRTATKP